MENLLNAFRQNQFQETSRTVKAIEFENLQNKEVIYLLPNDEITIALSPKLVADKELEDKSAGKLHSSAFKQFPKRKNKGKNLINYGYSFKFQSDQELTAFLTEIYKLVNNK